MATLNASKKTVKAQKVALEQTTNYEGEVAYKLSDHQRLIERVLGAFWNEKLFYESGKKISKEIVKDIHAVAKTDPKFILQLANFARNELYLRTTPQVLLVEASTIEECKQYIREYTPKIVKRADELADVVAYYVATRGSKKGFPNALKAGLAKAFGNFDEYQLNKYDSNKATVSIGDVVRLVHPFGDLPAEKAKALYNYLTKDEINAEQLPKIAAQKALLARDKFDDVALGLIKESGATWENVISKFGSSKETWEAVYPNMGYMALLRNLRNFQEKGVDLAPILDIIKDEKRVKGSKQLPFRFYSAYREVSDQKVQRAIAQAFEHSISNVTLTGSTIIVPDLSGSMGSPLSAKSKVSYADVAAVMSAMAIKKSDESKVVAFASTAQVFNLNPDDTMMTNMEQIAKAGWSLGGGTNPSAAFAEIFKNKLKADRIIILSDMQCYSTRYGGDHLTDEWKRYRKELNPNAWLYSIDLSAYGTSQFSSQEHNVITLNGWSDKILDLINLEENKNIMINKVRNY